MVCYFFLICGQIYAMLTPSIFEFLRRKWSKLHCHFWHENSNGKMDQNESKMDQNEEEMDQIEGKMDQNLGKTDQKSK